MQSFTLNIRGKIIEYTRQTVMGILNITPDSLYAHSRALEADAIKAKVNEMLTEGADFIDIGAYSTRPGHGEVSEAEEIRRLELGLKALREVDTEIPVSVDTFRAEVARKAITEMGADIVNDVTAGEGDKQMLTTVAELKVPYILTHNCKLTQEKEHSSDYVGNVLSELAEKVSELCLLGVNDIIIDPGFGFGKTMDQNYQLLANLNSLQTLSLPILVGVSRKSMITKLLGISADEAQNGTTVVNTIALEQGATILRVHDVRAACEAIKIWSKVRSNNNG